MAIFKGITTNAGKDAAKLEPLHIAGQNAN
jgi:hypothetical protein